MNAVVSLQRTESGYRLGSLHGELQQGLSPREIQALLCRAHGLTENETAQALSCSVSNIKHLGNNARFKLKVPRVTAAIASAFRQGIIHYCVAIVIAITASTVHQDKTIRPTRMQRSYHLRIARRSRNEQGAIA